MFRHQNVKVLFVYAGDISFQPKEYDLHYPDLRETVRPPWTTRKVIRAMEHIENHYNYNYLVRTNLSTFWYFKGLLERLSALPGSSCFSGTPSIFPLEKSGKHIVGTGMIMSRDIIQKIIKHASMINIHHPKYIAEDKMLSDFVIHTLGITPHINTTHLLRFESVTRFNDKEIYKILCQPQNKVCDHFRIKNPDSRMQVDIPLMKLLKDLYYPSVMSYNKNLYYRKGL
jgi:hypothetical protein